MDQVHFHLMLTHFPIVGTVGGVIMLIAGYFFSNYTVKRMALVVFICSALVAIPAFLTGEGAEEAVEKLPGVMESIIEEHEEIAEIYIWLIAGLGIVSALTLIVDALLHNPSGILYLIVFALAIVSIVFSYRVGNYGGQVRHTELRTNSGGIIQQENINSNYDED